MLTYWLVEFCFICGFQYTVKFCLPLLCMLVFLLLPIGIPTVTFSPHYYSIVVVLCMSIFDCSRLLSFPETLQVIFVRPTSLVVLLGLLCSLIYSSFRILWKLSSDSTLVFIPQFVPSNFLMVRLERVCSLASSSINELLFPLWFVSAYLLDVALTQ